METETGKDHETDIQNLKILPDKMDGILIPIGAHAMILEASQDETR